VFNEAVNADGADGMVSATDLATITAADFQASTRI
jgi:hypothetical protein